MARYEVIPSRVYQHVSGRTASIYGSVPWTSEADAPNWKIVGRGWTVKNPHTGQVGVGRQPFESREEADAFADICEPPRGGYGD